MRAAYYESFKAPLTLSTLPDPVPGPDDVVIEVKATGICRSDWHGWQGHDSDIRLPHVPGHEMAGVIAAVGKNIRKWQIGDRVTLPFCEGCGECATCQKGQEQICDRYYQPGFTGWGSFAELVRIPYANNNLVRLPDSVSFVSAAVLGCRFITSWRALLVQGRLQKDEWVAIHGCGGVGLSAIMIASSIGAKPIAIDIREEALQKATSLGAVHAINAKHATDLPERIIELTRGGADVSMDALGSRVSCRHSILCLRKQGRHVQVGLLAGKDADPPFPMTAVIARELEIRGSHGMQAHAYPEILQQIEEGKIIPEKLLGDQLTLEQGVKTLMQMGEYPPTGVSVITFQ